MHLNASACNFIKKEKLVQVFSCECWKIFKNTGSNVNEVIRAVLNSLHFFFQKDFTRTESTKAQRQSQAKAQNATSEQK